jgi:hypothetical protein
MTKKRSGELYDEILKFYSRLRLGAADALFAGVINLIWPDLND